MTEDNQALWDEVWDEDIISSCFACGDDVVVDIYLESQAVLCNMCSVEWERSISDFIRTDNLTY